MPVFKRTKQERVTDRQNKKTYKTEERAKRKIIRKAGTGAAQTAKAQEQGYESKKDKTTTLTNQTSNAVANVRKSKIRRGPRNLNTSTSTSTTNNTNSGNTSTTAGSQGGSGYGGEGTGGWGGGSSSGSSSGASSSSKGNSRINKKKVKQTKTTVIGGGNNTGTMPTGKKGMQVKSRKKVTVAAKPMMKKGGKVGMRKKC